MLWRDRTEDINTPLTGWLLALLLLLFIFGCIDLGCFLGFSLFVVSRGSSSVVVRGLLIVVASLVLAWVLGLQLLWQGGSVVSAPWAPEHMLSTCGARISLLCSMWDLLRPGIEPVSPALAGGLFTTESPRKLWFVALNPILLIFLWVLWVAQVIKNLSVMQETWIRSLFREYPLKKGRGTHPSILV